MSADGPEEYTNLWWRQQTRGILHSVNRCNAEYAAAQDQIEALGKRCTALEQELGEVKVRIGELLDSMDKARQAFKELKNGH